MGQTTPPPGISLVVMEASGGLQNLPAAAFAKANLPVAIVNPRQVRDFSKASGQHAKTDAIDAQMIAQFGVKMQPSPRQLPDEAQALLAELLARRRQLVQSRVAELNRLKTAQAEPIRRNIEASIRSLENLLAEIDNDIDEQVRNSPMWRVNEQLLTSVPGVGTTTARALLGQRLNLAAYHAVSSLPWQVWRHSLATAANGVANASFAQVVLVSVQLFTWLL